MNKPEEYLSLNTYQGKDAKEVLERFLPTYSWTSGENIIDVGSGPGNVTSGVLLPAIPKDAKLTGLDTSVEMVEFANKRFGSDRLQFKRVDVSSNFITLGDWKKEGYDKIFSFYCLNFIHDQEQTAKNFHYLLKKNGYLSLLFCGAHPFYEVYEILHKDPKWTKYITNLEDIVCVYQHVQDPHIVYSKILKDAGFDVKSCTTEIFHYEYPNVDGVIKMYAACNPYSDGIPKAMHGEYLEAVKKILIDIGAVTIKPSGAADLSYTNVIALARKV